MTISLTDPFTFTTNDWLTSDSYDNNGNTTNSSGNFYQYDPLNHVTNVNSGAVLVWYDGDGNRVKKTVGSTTTYYLLDDQNPSGNVQVLEEWTASGGTTNLSRVYNYALTLISQRQPGVSTNYFIFDGHGSTRVLADNGGNVLNAFAFDAYGNLIASNAAPQTAYLYSGQQFDSDLGQYNLRQRTFNADKGRFPTMDAYEGDPLSPQSLHRYAYCANEPIDNDDPSGNEIEGLLAVLDISGMLAAISTPVVTPTVEKIALSTNEPALMLERVLITETRGPEQKGFAKDQAIKGIKAMGAAIYHRAHAKELGFTSLNYPTNLLDVVKQKGQFAGFENYNPKDAKGGLSDDLLLRIDIFVQGANYPKDKKNYPNYVAVVKQVKATAQDVIKGSAADPFSPNYTFSWRTSGHGGPGGSFKLLGSAAGNSFYGLAAPKPPKK